jgi:alpha-D-xyloside xylohydrolase
VPWLFDEEAVEVLRKFTLLKLALMPYLFAHALEARDRGTPLMRAMMLEFPDDKTCSYLDRQYMLGANLLVAPVFSEDPEVTYYLPAGAWTNYFSGEVSTGPGWVTERHDFLSLPLMVRPNSVIAVGNLSERPDYDYGEGVTLRVYELEEGKQVDVLIPTIQGEVDMRFSLKREGGILTVLQQGALKAWSLLLVGIQVVGSVEGGLQESTPQGVRITPARKARQIKISLSS